MLTRKYIEKIGRMMEQTGGDDRCALDRHDNIEHRTNYDEPAVHFPSQPGERFIRLNLEYETDADGDLRIIKK